MHSRTAVVLLLSALTAGGALRTWLIAAKRTLNHDEAISYLCAAGKQGLYRDCTLKDAPPLGTWVPAAELKSFFEPQRYLCLGRIGRDLADTDIHPPLYFWLLHVWRLLVGLHLWTGPALNVLLAALGGVLLFVVARAILRNELAAAGAVAIWWFSPAVVATCFEARHYDLLALFSIAFVGALWSCVTGPAPRRIHHWLLLTLTTAGGLLTHYHFGLLPTLAAPWVLLRTRGDPRRLLRVTAAVAVGAALFVTIHPRFVSSILRARKQAQGFDRADIPVRVQTSLATYAAFFVRGPSVNWLAHRHWPWISLGVVCSGRLLLWLLFRHRRGKDSAADQMTAYLFLALATANIGLYIAGLSPKHAMGPQYPAMVWPLLALLIVRVVQTLPRGQTALLTALSTVLLVRVQPSCGR